MGVHISPGQPRMWPPQVCTWLNTNNKLELVMEIFLLFIPRHWCWKLGNAVVTWR